MNRINKQACKIRAQVTESRSQLFRVPRDLNNSPFMKLLRALSLILLFAVSAQGVPTTGSGDTPEEDEMPSLSFTPTNSSLDDILKELGEDWGDVAAVRYDHELHPDISNFHPCV